MSYYVSLDGITDEQLAILGYHMVEDNDEFQVYLDFEDNLYVVEKNSKRHMYVEDLNEALAINADSIINAPPTKVQ